MSRSVFVNLVNQNRKIFYYARIQQFIQSFPLAELVIIMQRVSHFQTMFQTFFKQNTKINKSSFWCLLIYVNYFFTINIFTNVLQIILVSLVKLVFYSNIRISCSVINVQTYQNICAIGLDLALKI